LTAWGNIGWILTNFPPQKPEQILPEQSPKTRSVSERFYFFNFFPWSLSGENPAEVEIPYAIKKDFQRKRNHFYLYHKGTTMDAYPTVIPDTNQLKHWIDDARKRTLELIADLTDDQLMGPRLDIVNPLLWEIGHIAWFYEKWILRHILGRESFRKDADALWDSIAIPHDVRWELPLPDRKETLQYMERVKAEILSVLNDGEVSPELAYFVRYSVHHEDMHAEAFTYTRQTLAYPAPQFSDIQAEAYRRQVTYSRISKKDIEIAGGEFYLGAFPNGEFVFDNEKWAHPTQIAPFAISNLPVTQGEFLKFVEDGGYQRFEFWSHEGWEWRRKAEARHPVYWKKETGDGWFFRHFDEWFPLQDDLPVIHVCYFEAEAYSRWAGRRLPTEAEWELAASVIPKENGKSWDPKSKRKYPWGDSPPDKRLVNMDWNAMGVLPVNALPEGNSAIGCQQMLGNVWEWTSSTFKPFPGFIPDLYKEYSEPWFYTRKVLRGGSWATRSRMLRNTWRNYFTPDRRDVFAGFRTCAL